MSSKIVCVVLAVFAIVTTVASAPAAPPEPKADKLGSKIELAPLHDRAGASALRADANATVIVFLSFDCPVSNSYAESLSRIASDYAAKGVCLLGVTATDATDADVARLAKEFKLGFPMIKDDRFAVADALKAATTPEAFVLDRHHILRYRGRIDDGFLERLKPNRSVTSFDLKNALDDVLAAKPVRVPATVAIGCPIQRELKTTNATAAVTYYHDVAPILQKNCQGCHRPGAVGPFSLMTCKQAVNWANDIKDCTQSRKMPPWKPSDGLPFAYERRLADQDIQTLAAWVDAGTPPGDPKDAPAPIKYVDGWALGPPDLVLMVPAAFQVGASGRDLFRVFVLPTGLTEDKFVTAFEVKPGNPRVVHHTLNFIDSTGAALALQTKEQERARPESEADTGPGYSVMMGTGIRPRGAIGGWAPGQVPHYLPEGVGYYLPKNSDIVLQVHYHRTGKVETDRTSIGLYFAKKPVQRTMHSLVVGLAPPLQMLTFVIPKDNPHFPIHRSLWVEQDCTLYSVMPHMHLLGREIKVTMTPPGGEATTLVAINDWDYNWQETYFFKEPIKVKDGTRFDIEAVYDNSRGNPKNPFDPPRPVRFGEQTTNEMCFGFLGVTSAKPGSVRFRVVDEKKTLLPRRGLGARLFPDNLQPPDRQ